MTNTLLIFYWDVADSYGFKRVHFQVVLEGTPFKDMSDACDWEDRNTSKIYTYYDFNIVFNHVILKYGPTKEDPVNVHIFKEEKLKLVVDKPKRKYNKTIKQQKEEVKPKYESKPEIKVVDNYNEGNWWINPSGEVFVVGWCGHNEFAIEYLDNHYSDGEQEELEGHYAYEKLENIGWIRIMGWKTPTCFVITKKVTVKQRQAMKEYCLKYNVAWEDRSEILKS